MRKGRSQRKTRGSLPPLSKRPHASQPGGGAGPQVVIGHTSPRSEDSSVDRREARGPEATNPTTNSDRGGAFNDGLEIVATLELVREPSLEIVRESFESEGTESQETEAVGIQEPEAVESQERESYATTEPESYGVDSLAGVEREPVSESDPFGSDPILRAIGYSGTKARDG